MKWTIPEMERCLAEYARFPCLWDHDHPDFKDPKIRNNAYVEIKREMNTSIPIAELKSNIAAIRSNYANLVDKIRVSKKLLGPGSPDVFKPRLSWFYMADSFLRRVMVQPEPESEEMLEPVQQQPLTSDSNLPTTENPSIPSATSPDEGIDNMQTDNYSISTVNSNRDRDYEEVEAMGKSIAIQIRMLNLEPLETVELMGEIQKTIVEKGLAIVRKREARRAADPLEFYDEDE